MDDMKIIIIISNRTSMFYMRMIPGKTRMGEVYGDVFGSITFATFGVTPVKGARSHVTTCPDVAASMRCGVRYPCPRERVLWVRRCHEDLVADKETASALGYAISACPSQNLRPTAFER